MMPLWSIHKGHINAFMAEYQHVYPISLCLVLHNRPTGHCNDLNLPKCRLATGQRMFSYRAAKLLYNDLPRDIKEIENIIFFKKILRNELRKNSLSKIVFN
jgi:hypothetical protein